MWKNRKKRVSELWDLVSRLEDVCAVRRRLLGLWTIFIMLAAVLLGRLFVLTMHPDGQTAPLRWQDSVRVRAVMEHLDGHLTDDGRGRILYRNRQALSGVVQHETLKAGGLSVPYRFHSERTGADVIPRAHPGMAVAGKVGLPDKWPIADKVVAEQGRSGLEARFDTLLRGERPGYIGVLKDVHGRADHDTVLAVEPRRGPDLRTTLDPAWQDAVERALYAAHIPLGSVVVLDIHSNQVLAMANRSQSSFGIPAVTPAVPGSIMKLVTAAAAFDSYRLGPGARFYCNGVSQLEGVSMHCWTTHGSETLTQAIARSCDIALAVVGTKVHRAGIQTMWDRLHLSDSNLQQVDARPVLDEAKGGVLFRHSGDDNGLLANTAIGQEDVRMTPVAAANLASTIASGGLYRDVRLLLDAERDGQVARRFEDGRENRAMSPFTAQKLSTAMMQAITDPQGTAHYLSDQPVPAGAKTGTAELPDGRVNGWLIGFAPANRPEIAFSVFTGDLPESAAHQSVRHITTAVLQAYRQFRPVPGIG